MPSDRRTTLVRIARAIAGGVTLGGVASVSNAADLVGWVAESSSVVSGGVEYAVLDVYAEFDPTNVVALNVYNASISNAGGTAFEHSDINTLSGLAGSWSPALTGAFGGLDPSIDSFVLVGGQPGGSNTTTLDPNFDPADAAVPPANAGWFNNSPPNQQGLADPATGRVWVGRFSTLASVAGDTLEFTASATFAETPDGPAQQLTRSATFDYPTIACDALIAVADATSIGASGTTAPISIAIEVANGACAWSASSDASWLSLSADSGVGDASVTFTATENTGAERSATITVASGTASDVAIVVTQAAGETGGGCIASVDDDATQVSFIGSLYGDQFGFDVSTDEASCVWTATSATPWITVESGSGGSGSGTVAFTVEPNFFLPTRSGTVQIVQGGEVVAAHTVVQGQAAAECSGAVEFATSVVEVDAETSTRSVAVSTGGVGCAWYASSNDAWITVEDGGSFTGDGVVTFSTSANAGGSPRSGSISIGSGDALRTLSIEQAGPCGFAISPSQQGVSYLGSLYGDLFGFSIDTEAACEWSVSVEAGSPPWIAIDGATAGSGAASISFSTEINLFQTQRTGTISVIASGVVVATHTVVQAGPAIECTEPVSLDPGMPTMDSSGGTVEIAVSTNGVTCAWYAESNDEWIGISSGGSFTGDGTMVLDVAENAGSETRSGTVTIGTGAATTTLEVVQAGTGGATCDLLAATAEETAVEAAGTSSPVAVSIVVGGDECAWSVVVDAGWISVSPSSGTGSGSFAYSASATDSAEARTATIVVASGTATPVSIEIVQAGDPCLVDTDGDGAGDCDDACPNDPNKVEPGICGCGVDDSAASEWYPDADGDGYGDATASPTVACAQPDGFVADATDCDDASATTHPGAEEICDDLVDNDCDGEVDEGCEAECDTIAVDEEQIDVPAIGTTAPTSILVSVPGANCSWSASSPESWITIGDGSGFGDGSFMIDVGENLSVESRSGVIEVSGGTASSVVIVVTQFGFGVCDRPETLDPASIAVSSGAGASSFGVTTPEGTCGWMASVVEGGDWLSIVAGGSGVGAGTVFYEFAANDSGQSREAVIALSGGGIHTVVQASPGGCPPWTPESLDALAAWWSADSIEDLSDGDSVEIWPGLGPNGLSLVGSSGREPRYQANALNGLPMVVSDGDVLQIDDTNLATDVPGFSVFGVFRPDVAGASQNLVVITRWSHNGRRVRLDQTSANEFRMESALGQATPGNDAGGNQSISGGAVSVGEALVVGGVADIGEDLTLSVDGRLHVRENFGVSGHRYSDVRPAKASVLANRYASQGSTGAVGEVVMVDAALSSDDRQRLEGYLAHKWGLETRLPEDHPYRVSAPLQDGCANSLVVTPESSEVPAPGNPIPIEVDVAYANGESTNWSAFSGSNWLSVVESVQTPLGGTFGLVAQPNPGLERRMTTVTVQSESGEVVEFEITQVAPCEHLDGRDCDADGVPDLCAVLWGQVEDSNGNAVPDSCEWSDGDLNLDGVVDGADLTVLLGNWGSTGAVPGDLSGDGVVDGVDLAELLARW